MIVSARRLLRLLAILLVAFSLLFLLLHTPPLKRAASRAALALLERFAGGSAAFRAFDYRLWRGEFRIEGLSWTKDGVAVEAREVIALLSLRGLLAVRVLEPDVRIEFADAGGGGVPEIPAILLETRIALENGTVRLEWPRENRLLELASFDATLESARVDFEAATGRIHQGEGALEFGPARARLRLGRTEVQIEEARIVKDGSFVAASGTLRPLSPLGAEMRFEHSIEGALLSTIDPGIPVQGVVEGEGTLTRRPGSSDQGEGVLRTREITVRAIGPFSGEASWRLRGLAASADVSFESQEAGTFPPFSSGISGRLALSIEGLDFETARGEGTLSLSAPSRRGAAGVPLRGDVEVRFESKEVAFTAPRLTIPGAEIAASGTIAKSIRARYRARIGDLGEVTPLFRPLGIPEPPVPLTGSLVVEGTVAGTTDAPSVDARIAGDAVGIGGRTFAVTGGAAFRGARVELSEVRLHGTEAGSIVLDGAIPTSARGGDFDLDARIESLSLAGIVEAISSGTLDGSFSVSGEIARPSIAAVFTASDLATTNGLRADARGEARSVGFEGVMALSLGNASFRGKALPGVTLAIESDGDTARLATRLDDGTEIVSAEIVLSAPYPLQAEVPLANLPFAEIRDLFPSLVEAGMELEVSGQARLEATLSHPEDLHYRVEVAQVLGLYRGIALGATSPFVVEGALAGLSVSDLTLVGEDTAIGIDGVVPLSRDGSVVLHARGATRLELLRPWFPELEPAGRANVDVRLEGALPDPWLRGDLSIEEASARFGSIEFENVSARASWNDRALVLEGLSGETLGGRIRVEGELPPQLDVSAPVRLRFEASDLEPLRLLPGGTPAFLEGAELQLSGDGALEGAGTDLSRWRGEGALETVRFGMQGLEIANEVPGVWSLDGGKLSVSDFRMTSGETRLVLEGEALPLESPLSWSARASGRIDNEVSRLFLEDLGLLLTGGTDVDVRVEKRGDTPIDLSGRGTFADARLVVRDPPIAFTSLSGEIALSGSSIELTRLSGDAGGGRVEAEGTLSLGEGGVRDVDMRATARSLRLNYPEGLRSEVSGSLRLSGGSERLRLSGDVDLTRALLSRDISVETELLRSLSRVSAAAAPSSLASRIELDLRVRAAEAFRIDNNLARMEASVNLTVAGSVAAPELSGIASVRQGGRFRFGGNEYRVETGRIMLSRYPAEAPELDITARTSVGPYDIRLVLQGPTDNLSTELSSESHPTLSRGDVASILITGRPLSELSTESRDIVSNRMVSYLGATLADLAKLGIGEALPFEIITAQPSLIAGEADPGARFTIGARLEDLSLVYSIGLDNAEDQIWVVDYELPRRITSQIVRDQDNEYSLGLSQEVRFDVRRRSRFEAPKEVISEVLVTVENDASGATEAIRGRLDAKPGDRFDYWKIWEKAERARRELRSRGYLEAIVDVATSPRANGGVGVEYRVRVGPRVTFSFPDDEPDGSLRKALENAWTGEASDSFLTVDLANLATGKLFEKGYFTATAEVTTERTERELSVKVFLRRGPRGKRVAVDITGNEAVEDSFLLEALPKPRSAAFHELVTTKRPRLKQILTLQYASIGYAAASIGDPETLFDERSGEFRVAIPVTEGPRFLVGEVELEGVGPEDEAELRGSLSLKKGEPFRVQSFAEDRSAAVTFYRERGFLEVEVEGELVAREETAELGARFVVRPGPRVTLGDVEVRGNEATRESVIRREVKSRPGVPLSASSLRETERGLYELGIFQSADVVVERPSEAPAEGAEPSPRSLRIAVVETQDLALDYGARASTDGFFEVLTELRAPNLFGRAQHAGLRALVGSERKIFRFSYHSPYLSRYRLDTDFFVERSIEHLGEAPEDFTDRAWTFTAQQTRSITEEISAQWSYTFRRIVNVPEFPTDFEPASNKRSIVTGSVIGEHRDNLLHPRRGTLWLLTAQLAPEALGSDLKYTKLFGQLFAYVPLWEGVVWASGYRVGAANGFGEPLRREDGFRAGGPNSVRGFEQDSLGPEDLVLGTLGGGGLAVFNQEIRFPLWWRLRGVGFYDAGNAFETASDISLSDLRQNVGIGLRLDVGFGALRVDWARVVNPLPGEKAWRLLFSLGDAF
jgi:outer membrane protein insertion porin family